MDELQELHSLITNSRKAESWIRQGIRKVKYEDLKKAIESNEPADKILFSHFDPYLRNPLTSRIIIAIFRIHWGAVERILRPENLYELLTETRPEFQKLFGTKEGLNWLNECSRRGGGRLWGITWG